MDLGLNAYDFLASSLDEACKGGHLPNPSLKIASAEDNNSVDADTYILAIRSRLIDLGYLGESKDNRSKISLDKKLKNAIRKFQQEAGLKNDAWVGRKTWGALQQLVSFEDGQDPDNWRKELKENLSQPAILRAVYLRLYALGFFEWSKKLHLRRDFSLKSNIDFKSAFKAFLETARKIGLLEKSTAPVINRTTLRALYQQDKIIHALNRNPNFVLDRQNKKFVEAVARIEFWLLGFNVNVGNPRIQFRKREDHKFREKATLLSLALQEFWQQQPVEERPKSKWDKENVTPKIFKQLVALEEEEDQNTDNFAEQNLIKRINKFSKTEQDMLENRLKNIASSVWDGVKRVFRWIKRFIKKVKKVVKTALNEIKNIARFIAGRADGIFGTVKKVFEIIYRGTVYLRKALLPGSDAQKIVIYHDKDFDTAVFLNTRAESHAIKHLLDCNHRESVCFGAACRILAHLIAILKRAAQAIIAGVGGWFLALLALTRLAVRVKEINKEVDLVEKFDIGGEPSPFAN
jgi:peptidoglycan hydrolase-like protein with peptidoglycan-binding domain